MFKSFFQKIKTDPLWYLKLDSEVKELLAKNENDSEAKKQKRLEFFETIGMMLSNGEVALAKTGENFDKKRKPIDTIIIHHSGISSTKAKNALDYINGSQMFSLYISEFLDAKREYFHTPLWSNHFYKTQMTFVAYHYLIFPYGKYLQTLDDEYIGWHCGNWDYNTRSIAVCFVDDLEEKEPTESALKSAREIITSYPNTKVLGHSEVVNTTFCPGKTFLGENGWKKKLIV